MTDNELLRKMGERTSRRRKSLNMTQEALADKLGVSCQMISNLEQGKKAIRPENLVKLCEALKLSADYVLTGGSNQSELTLLTEKMASLNAEELQMVETLIDYMGKK